MKMTIHLLAILCLINFTTACQIDKDDLIEQLMTNEEAAEVIESLMSAADGGFTKELEAATQIAVEDYEIYMEDCDYGADSTFTCSNAGNVRSYDWETHYQWAIECNNASIPTLFNFKSEKTGSYNGPRLDRAGEGLANLEISNLSPVPAGTPLQLTGGLDFDGTEILSRHDETLNTAMDMSLSSLQIDKTSLEIISGTGTFSMTVTGMDGTSQGIDGSLRFLGGGSLEVTINGQVFVVSM